MLGVLPGIMGTLQATEALKLLLGIGEPLVGRLLLVDALDATFHEVRCGAIRTARSAASNAGEIHYIDYEEFCARARARVAAHLTRAYMPVKLRMPPILRPQVGGARDVEVDGATLREALDDLFGAIPAVRGQIVDDDGELNRSSTSTSRTRTCASARASRRAGRRLRP